MHKPRFFDEMDAESALLDRCAFSAHLAGERRPFQPDYVEPKWPRDRVVDIKHIRLDVTLDFKERRISGTATHRLAAILDGLTQLEFDGAEMEIAAVRAGAKDVAFDHSDEKLRVTPEKPLAAGEEIEVAIDYSARPRRGLYFVGPDDAYPNKPPEAWTQGEDEDSRYWFPCYDYPNNRTTSEVIATVPEKFTVISNGALIATSANPTAKTRTFHWRHDVPHSAYLITLAAGEFTMIEERAGETPVTYYVHPGREDDARRASSSRPG